MKSLLKYPNESDSINQLMQPNFFFVAPGDKRTELAKSLHDCRFDLVPVLDKGLLVGAAGILRASFMNIGWDICIVVSLSLVCITLWSAIISSVIPLLLKRCGIDPAVVSAPFITTLVDGTGLIIYFEIAKVVLNI